MKTTAPVIDGAVNACMRLQSAGYEIVRVSAAEQRFQAARLQNYGCDCR